MPPVPKKIVAAVDREFNRFIRDYKRRIKTHGFSDPNENAPE